MPTKPTYEIQTSNTQAKSRKLVTVYDQHKSARFPNGRPWWGYAEMPAERGAAWGFVGSLQPGDHEIAARRDWSACWEAPWYPDAKWLQPNVETGKLVINYLGMIAEYTQATRKYYEQCAAKADENKWVAPAFGGPVDSRFRAVVGRDVPQSPKVPQAAQAGDPWILGFTAEINEPLFRILKNTSFGSGVTVMESAPEIPPAAGATTPDIQALIDAAVQKALGTKTPSPAKIAAAQRMRDAKVAKRQSQAQASGA